MPQFWLLLLVDMKVCGEALYKYMTGSISYYHHHHLRRRKSQLLTQFNVFLTHMNRAFLPDKMGRVQYCTSMVTINNKNNSYASEAQNLIAYLCLMTISHLNQPIQQCVMCVKAMEKCNCGLLAFMHTSHLHSTP